MQFIHKGVRFEANMVKQINLLAANQGLSFSDMVRKLVAIGLSQNSNTGSINNASNLPEYERKRINLDVKTWIALEKILGRIYQDNHHAALQEINEKATQHLKKHYFNKEII